MKSKSFANKILSIICNLLWIALGIFALCTPDTFSSSLGIVAGSFMIAIGAFMLLFAIFSTRLIIGTGFFALEGVVTLALGIFLVCYHETSMVMVTIILAFYFLISGLSKFINSLGIRKFKIKSWWVTTIIGILYFSLGIVLFVFTDESSVIVTYILGSFFIISGFLGLLELIDTYKRELKEKTIINNINRNVDNLDHIDIDFTKDDKFN